jgi:LEA14-like dessication related protein
MQQFLYTIGLLFLSLILLSSGCTKVKEPEYLGIKSTRLESISFSNAALRVNLEYRNPNKFGVDVKQTNLSIYLNNKFIGLADQPEKTAISAQSTFVFPVVVHFDPFKVLGSAFTALFSKTNEVRVQGSAKVGMKGIYIQLPVNITENVSILK